MEAYILTVEVVTRADGYWLEAKLDGAPYSEPIGPFERFGEAVLAAEDMRKVMLELPGTEDIGRLN
jgi:hypothetical protein